MADKEKHLKHLISGDLFERLESARERRDTHWVRYESATQDCAALERVIDMVSQEPDEAGCEITNRQDAPREATVRDDAPRLGTIPSTSTPGVLIQTMRLDDCRNAEERLIRMAHAWGGMVDCRIAAELLIGMGLSSSSVENLTSTLQKELTKKEHRLWEYVDQRTYRYLPYGKAESDAEGEASSPVRTSFL